MVGAAPYRLGTCSCTLLHFPIDEHPGQRLCCDLLPEVQDVRSRHPLGGSLLPLLRHCYRHSGECPRPFTLPPHTPVTLHTQGPGLPVVYCYCVAYLHCRCMPFTPPGATFPECMPATVGSHLSAPMAMQVAPPPPPHRAAPGILLAQGKKEGGVCQ